MYGIDNKPWISSTNLNVLSIDLGKEQGLEPKG